MDVIGLEHQGLDPLRKRGWHRCGGVSNHGVRPCLAVLLAVDVKQ